MADEITRTRVQLPDGYPIPQVGYGVFEVPSDETRRLCGLALEAGYRHIDTARFYGNEEAVGEAVLTSGLPREEVFVTTKLWNSDQGYDETLRAFEGSLNRLRLGYVDLFLIHWPVPSRDLYLPSWKALGRLRADGLVRSIGVSNFHETHLRRIVDETGVVPAVNQVELHPYLQQAGLRQVNTDLGILTQAWSPLARGRKVLDDPVITGLAAKHGRTAAQVILRWHLQLGNIVLPRSQTPSRIVENLTLEGFELDAEDLATVAGLERDGRIGPNPDDMARAAD